jgi:DNA-binding transcriptional MerR regulator
MGYLTGKQIADELGRPATTVRTWGQIYKDFIPHKVENNRTFYLPESLDVFKKIQQFYNQQLLQPQIKEALSKSFSKFQEAEIDGVGGNEIVVRQEYQEMIGYFQQKLQRDDELITLQRQELEEMKEQTKLLKEALNLGRNQNQTSRINKHKKNIPLRKKNKKININKKTKTIKKKNWLSGLWGK